MTFRNKLSAVRKILAVRFLGKRIPLVVTWPITNQCNFRCQYCERWQRKTKELTTKQVFEVIDRLQWLGTIRISLSGGEPLTRPDIGRVIDYAKDRGISVVVTSNGSLVQEKIDQIKRIDLLKLSLEGKEKVHDRIRGRGSFKKVVKAVAAARQAGVQVVFNSVLTVHNFHQIDFLLSLAEEHQTGVRFTALNVAHAGEARIKPLFPEQKDYRAAVDKLIRAKKAGRPVLNSLAGLKHLRSWPEPQALQCFAGRAFAHLSAEGKLYPCVVMEGKVTGEDVLRPGFSKAFKRLPNPVYCGREEGRDSGKKGFGCPGCWCGGTLELNLLVGLEPRTILNLKGLV